MTSSIIGIDTKTDQRVAIYKLARLLGLYIIGVPGTGKTGLIENLIIQDIIQGVGVGLLDPHGDLTKAVLSRLPDRRMKDVIYLDITDYHYPFGLNLFECSDLTDPVEVQKTVDQVMHIFERLFEVTRTTPLIIQYLRNCTHTLIANPGYTMADIPLLLRNKECRSKLVAKVRDRNVLGFWQDYEDMRPSDQRAEREPILRRLEELLQPLTFNIVGQSTTIDMRQVMDEGKILLVQLSAQLPQVTSLIGSILVALVLNAAYSRTNLPVNKRRQFNLYADEFQQFATDDFATLLTEARKFGIATTIAHQARYQPGMTDGIRATSLSAANLIVFKVSSKDASELAGEFDITPAPERVEEIEKEQLIGQRPVRTYKHDVVGHLLHQSSEDERIAVFVKKYLQELHLASNENIERKREAVDYTGGKHGNVSYRDKTILPINHLGIKYDPEAIPAVLMELNEWLFEGMKYSDDLWQPLPDFTFRYLSHFFDFEAIYNILYADLKFYVGRELFLTKHNLTSQESVNSGFSNREWVQTAVAALEDALVDFLSTLFPNRSHADIKTAWQQKAIDLTTCDYAEILARSRATLERITEVVREEAHAHPDLDVAAYKRQFILELSRPELAIDVFLPALFHAHNRNSFDIRDWWVPQREYVYLPYHKSDTKQTYTLSLELHKQGLHQAVMEELPKFIEPFQIYMEFCADLHCAQLALSQQPIMTTDSGHYEQDMRTQTHYIMHSQRSYQDRLNEVASELVNLPLYTARVRMTTEAGRAEYTMKTLDPKEQSERPLFGQALQERKDHIKKQNIQYGYLRQLAEVEEEIRQRQEQCNETTENEPPISRRPSR